MSMSTVLQPYQRQALITAQPPAFYPNYLIPGIVGEVGEMFGQRAKAFWHGWPSAKLQAETVNEYGDICWMTAVFLSTYHISTVELEEPHPYDPWVGLLTEAQNLYALYAFNETYISNAAKRLWSFLEINCNAITDTDFDIVLATNLTKLASRAERGVLRGSGDHR